MVTAGRMICATCYCGDDVDFGNGPHLFIDNHGPQQGLLLKFFKDYFENPLILKAFHNYNFDKHVFLKEGINVRGLAGDTLRMARLWDTSLAGWEGRERQAAEARQNSRLQLPQEFSISAVKFGGVDISQRCCSLSAQVGRATSTATAIV